ncbi:MAG: anaerobic ribonucleoside-triphosphate reductase activating protein [Clostridia bacterium]|nr:anaerobic ribonucleoside-triphosphate reductase activating protein [Clostridia bacterium]
MLFAGLQKLTLLDYPGHTACTVFTQGCDFRCPFCHNASLLDACAAPEHPVLEDDVLAFLRKRQGTLDGVCVTGGEPLLHPELYDFILRARELGFDVKLDTNGNHPAYLRRLIDERLLAMVAMDVKNSPAHYARTVGLPRFDIGPVRESAALLMENKVPFEFRTTVTNELHSEEDFAAIGQWLQGDEPYFLQCYVDSGHVLHPGLTAPSRERTEAFRAAALPFLPNTSLRGV